MNILVDCAQTTEVGELIEMVFVFCFYVKFEGSPCGWPGAQPQGQSCCMVVLWVVWGAVFEKTRRPSNASGPRRSDHLLQVKGPRIEKILAF